MRYLLDTNAAIGLLNDATSKLAKRARQERHADIAISAIVAHELFYGAFRSGRPAQNVGLIDALQFAVLEFDREDARRAGAVRALLASRGTPIGPYDVLIAGQALARNMILITHNTDEFGRVPGLQVEDWEA
ncbi:MAG TPA: type II toxin-antitoxin system VapC family toxin [Xanthobacteraceae bacterium]|nr:type II toxin-antitoxin system VapC family toxin [Xanthobacteraceae bacterium]